MKKFLKDKLGSKYYKFRLKNILTFLFGKYYINGRNLYKNFISKFNFIKTNLNKKIEFQSIVKKERGLVVDLTKNNFFTYHLRPKYSDNFYLESTNKPKDKFAIIIQGPVGEKFNFLKNTINIYKKIFKNCIIIVSTWENENRHQINSLKNENTFIIFSKEPEKSLYNINHQILSTSVALEIAKKNGAKYSIKTRTDVRLYKNNLENFIISLVKTFPIKTNSTIESRIIVPSLVTYKYRIYSLSDIVMAGKTVDLLEYFDPMFFEESLKKIEVSKNYLFKNKTPVVAEIFLCARMLMKINNKLDWSLDDWWNSLKDYYCIVDNSSFDLFWYKYDWEYENRFLRTYSDKFARAIDFQDWLALYNNLYFDWKLNSAEHEKYNENFQLTNIFKN